jgi:hypothetical protein
LGWFVCIPIVGLFFLFLFFHWCMSLCISFEILLFIQSPKLVGSVENSQYEDQPKYIFKNPFTLKN